MAKWCRRAESTSGLILGQKIERCRSEGKDAGHSRLVIDLPRSKTDQEAAGRQVGIPRGHGRSTCPVRAVELWLNSTGITAGALLRPITKNGRVLSRALHPDSIGLIIKRAAARAGMDVRSIAGHSLRSGCVSQAARNKCSEEEIMRQTGHKSIEILRRYIRGARIIADSPARRLGL